MKKKMSKYSFFKDAKKKICPIKRLTKKFHTVSAVKNSCINTKQFMGTVTLRVNLNIEYAAIAIIAKVKKMRQGMK